MLQPNTINVSLRNLCFIGTKRLFRENRHRFITALLFTNIFINYESLNLNIDGKNENLSDIYSWLVLADFSRKIGKVREEFLVLFTIFLILVVRKKFARC